MFVRFIELRAWHKHKAYFQYIYIYIYLKKKKVVNPLRLIATNANKIHHNNKTSQQESKKRHGE